jgi:ArsR family transcriptional regulator
VDIRIYPQSDWDRPALKRLAVLFADLSHPLRLEVVANLMQAPEECVCNLARRCGVDQPTLSRHLRILKDHGVLADRREGTNVFYRLVDGRVVSLLRSLKSLPVRPRGDGLTEEVP